MVMMRTADVVAVPVDTVPVRVHPVSVTIVARGSIGVMGIDVAAHGVVAAVIVVVMMPRMRRVAIGTMVVTIPRLGGIGSKQ